MHHAGSHSSASEMRMKKILLISNVVMHYRVSVYNYFHRRFREDGIEFEVLTNELQSANRNRLSVPLEIHPFDFGWYRREVSARNPDAIILFLHLKDRLLWPLFHWLKWQGIPVALWTKTRNLDDPHNFLKNQLFNYLMRLSDGLILYSGQLIDNVPVSARGKAFTANNTINTHDFPEVPQNKEFLKQALGIPFQKVVLFVGRMDVNGGRKHVDHLIRIFREFDHPEWGLVIVGSGMSEEWKRQMNPRNTLYLGEVHDEKHEKISQIFKLADIFGMPGHVGLGLNQAFHWGLPVVTEAGKQPPEVGYLVDGRNGFMVGENDVSALKSRIQLLLENDELRRQMSRNAREDIQVHASIDGMYAGFKACVDHMTP